LPITRPRGVADCACVALANLTGESYEDCYVAVAVIDPICRGKSGLDNWQVIIAADELGLTLQATKRYSLDEDDGILRLRWRGRKGKENPGGHFVAVRDGHVLEGPRLAWRVYLEANGARACTLLREVA
jgi:hypothetical protein